MRRQHLYPLLLFICLIPIPNMVCGQGSFSKVGTSGAHFLSISPDARYAGMANTAVSLVHSTAMGVFYNPASLVLVDGASASFGSVDWFADIDYTSAALSSPIGRWSVGLHYRSLDTGPIAITTVDEQGGTGSTYAWKDMALGVSAARFLADRFSFGASLYFISESISEFGLSANAVGVDLGTLYVTGFRSLRIGMSVKNFGPEMIIKDEEGKIAEFEDYADGEILPEKEAYRPFHMPLQFQVGISYDFLESSDSHNLTVALDGVHPNDSFERLSVGVEYDYRGLIFMRGGFYSMHDTALNMAGVGARVAGFGVDYAISNYRLLGLVHQFTISFSGAK